MKLEMRGQLRLEQQLKLAPHIIQSMEILQLSILALQERIEQELNANPVLEVDEPAEESAPGEEPTTMDDRPAAVSQKDFDPAAGPDRTETFRRVDTLDDEFKSYLDHDEPSRAPVRSDEPDPKLEAIKNTAAPPQSLHDYLEEQWRMVESPEAVKKAGDAIIDYIDDKGYLSVRLEQLHTKERSDFTADDLTKALPLIQKLDPPGVGARDLQECLLIQLAQSTDDVSFETQLVSEHIAELLENRLPDIAKKMNCTLERINQAVERLSKFDTSPGLQIGRNSNHSVTPDVIVEFSEDAGDYVVRLADDRLPRLRISDYYSNMAKTSGLGDNDRKFLQDNIRSAQWIIDAIQQRRNTLLNVTRTIVRYQRDFFDKGQLHLRPLPMGRVAADVGVHIATVSRAVAGKYVQCAWGILPLRRFFSGGLEDASGQEHSWEAIRGKLQQIIDSEDKSNPLSDDQIRTKLAEAGITGLARRTVAKYRKLLSIPIARLRRKY